MKAQKFYILLLNVLKIGFHFRASIVYDPKNVIPGGNEEESIKVFLSWASTHKDIIEDASTTSVIEMIRCTIKHELPEKERVKKDAGLFLDFDLAILGESQAVYNEYKDQIRKEYGHFSDEDYRAGRTKVLEGFLSRKQIFFTKAIGETREEAARYNMIKEVELLKIG